MQLAAVFFDIDGTLVDTNAAHVEAWQKAFAEAGHRVSAERLRPEIGKGGDQLVPAILGERGEQREGDALRKGHDDAFRQIAQHEHFTVFPDVQELFAAVHRLGLKTALTTSSKLAFVKLLEKSAEIDLHSLADLIVTSDDVAASKPAPDLVVATLQKLKLRPEQCLFIGDTPHDVEAAGRAGMACVGLLCGGCTTEEALHNAGARSVWRDPSDLLEHLDEALTGKCLV